MAAQGSPLRQSMVFDPPTNQPVAPAAPPAAPAEGWGASLKNACTKTRDVAVPFFTNVLLLGGLGVSLPVGSVYLTNQLVKECPKMKGALIWMPAVAISAVAMLLILKAGNNLMNYFKDEQNGFAFRLFGYNVLSLTKTV